MRTIGKRLGVLIAGLAIVGAVTVPRLTASADPTPSIPAIDGYTLPVDIPGLHIQLEPLLASTLGTASIGTNDQAISLARGYAGGLALNPKGVSAQLVSFTALDQGQRQPDGTVVPTWVDVPAWIVRFVGVPQPIYGPPGASGVTPAQELNVVLDARTGAYIEMFSYK